jgi:hypothetical protein
MSAKRSSLGCPWAMRKIRVLPGARRERCSLSRAYSGVRKEKDRSMKV